MFQPLWEALWEVVGQAAVVEFLLLGHGNSVNYKSDVCNCLCLHDWTGLWVFVKYYTCL